eukprot:CAMPEP_0197516490 /NCGR_PEP_ID=MMETSP1318-20131121/1364_1 /TAXON_ID=552666 /ORGANISM="Partenskyella glossopodia, Strain RCC365" /LENGTH=268 /DNA_ID=CAMNT_0043065271 /DNA_START=42 /DNA_END=848 /DNA_ORIENTATION=-
MKTTLALSCVLNAALFATLCVLSSHRSQGPLASSLAVRSSVSAPVARIAPIRHTRGVKSYAENPVRHHTPAPVAPGKIRIRVGAPLAAAATAGVCNLANVFPAAAAAGKIFDFDMTLPYMATEIMLLSFFLDKLWFKPLGTLIEERDSMLKNNLESASGSLEECDKIIAFAENSLKELETTINTERDERLSALNAECDAAMAATKEKVNAEIDAALAGIEKDRQVVLSSMSKEIDSFCWQILDKVLPEGGADDWKKQDAKLFEKQLVA